MTTDDPSKPHQGLFSILKGDKGFQIQVMPLARRALPSQGMPAEIQDIMREFVDVALAIGDVPPDDARVLVTIWGPGARPMEKLEPALAQCVLPLLVADQLERSLSSSIGLLRDIQFLSEQ